MNNVWKRLVEFIKEGWAEMKKVTWPSRQEIVESTSVVLITVVLMTVFIGLCDGVLSKFVEMILGQGR